MIIVHVSDDGREPVKGGPYAVVVCAGTLDRGMRERFRRWVKAIGEQLAKEDEG